MQKRLLVAFFAVSLVACAAKPKQAPLAADLQETFAQAESVLAGAHADRDELGRALDLYRKVLAKEPAHARSWLGLGKIVRELGYRQGLTGYEEPYVRHSLQFIEKALALNPASGDAAAEMAFSQVILKDFKGAGESLKKARKNFGPASRVGWVAALHAALKGDTAQAMREADQAMAVAVGNQEKVHIHRLRAEIFALEKNWPAAVQSRIDAANLLPQDHWLAGDTAQALSAAGRWGECREWAERALELKNYGMARQAYWTCAIEDGKPDLALHMKWKAPGRERASRKMLAQREYFQKFAPVLGPVSESQLARLERYYDDNQELLVGQENFEAGQRYYLLAKKAAAAATATGEGDSRESLKWLDKALLVDPLNFTYVNAKVEALLFNLKDKKAALRFLQSATAKKFDPKNLSRLHVYRAQIECEARRFAVCAEDAKAAVRLNPANEFAYISLFASLWEGLSQPGKLDGFLADLENRIDAPKEFLQWRAYLLIMKDRDFTRAKKLLAEALKLDPQYPLAHLRMAFAQYGLGERAAALASLDNAIKGGLNRPFLVSAKMFKGTLIMSEAKETRNRDLMMVSLESFADALKLDPNNPEALHGYRAAERGLASIGEKKN
jgi:tetratricopeptide (TPR) repeat protein